MYTRLPNMCGKLEKFPLSKQTNLRLCNSIIASLHTISCLRIFYYAPSLFAASHSIYRQTAKSFHLFCSIEQTEYFLAFLFQRDRQWLWFNWSIDSFVHAHARYWNHKKVIFAKEFVCCSGNGCRPLKFISIFFLQFEHDATIQRFPWIQSVA